MNDYNIHPLAIPRYLFGRSCSHQICFPKLAIRLLITGCFCSGYHTNRKKSKDRASKSLYSKIIAHFSSRSKEKKGKQGRSELCEPAPVTCVSCSPPGPSTGIPEKPKTRANCLQQNKRNLLMSKERYS